LEVVRRQDDVRAEEQVTISEICIDRGEDHSPRAASHHGDDNS